MRSLDAVALVGFVALSASASAELPVAPLVDIYESYNDCFKVATKDGLKSEALAGLGWSPATVTGKDGTPIQDGPVIYGNPARKPVILLSTGRDGGACTVMARLENVDAFAQFTKAWGGQLPAADASGLIGFYVEGQPVALRQTGTAEMPALTISVMTPMEKK